MSHWRWTATLAGLVLGILAASAGASAQSAVTGVWRVEGVEREPTFVFRAGGSQLTGTLRIGAWREIADGRIEGDRITFTVSAGGYVMTFSGTVAGDTIAFTQTREIPPGVTPAPSPLVRLTVLPPRFTARRLSDSTLSPNDREQIESTDQVRGNEFAAAVNLPDRNVKAVGTLFVPRGLERARAVIVVIGYGLGQQFFWDSQVRQLADASQSALLLAAFPSIAIPVRGVPADAHSGGAEALLLLLRRFAEETGHGELSGAPLLFWGHSGAGPFGMTFASMHPQRTIAFVRYQSGPMWSGDLNVVKHIPALFVQAGTDSNASVSDAEKLWKSGRSLGAPWTVALQREAHHGVNTDMRKANVLLIPWVTAVLRDRLSTSGAPLRVVSDQTGWLADSQTGEAATHASFAGSKLDASWLPDEPAARGWRAIFTAENPSTPRP